MALEKILQYGDIGVLFDVLVTDYFDEVIDLSSATTKEIILKKPSGKTVTKTASFVTDGIDGRISYLTIADDIDEVGVWQIQVHIVMPSSNWRSEVGSFRVKANV